MELKIKPVTIGHVMSYKQVYTTPTNGTESYIRYTTTTGTTLYNDYRFYPIPNVTTYTQIGPYITGSAAQTDYNFKINNPAFNNSVGHKVVTYVNVTTPTTGSMGSKR